MHWYTDVLKKYTEFSGRARRQEYWMFFLFNFIISIVISIIDAVLGLGFLGLIYMLAVLLPSIAVAIRRLHDTDRSGWWFLIGFVPLIGGIWLLVLLVLEGTSGENQYGADPKA
jgi:uncharacterized membrane protein YhaH (DUF805 family)